VRGIVVDGDDSPEQRAALRDFAGAAIAPHVEEAEATRQFPTAVREALAEAGCFGRTLPVEYGGDGQGLRAFVLQQEELARVWPTAAVAATWANLAGRLISRHGSDDQKDTLIPGLVSGAALGAVAFTEPQGGSDAAAIETTARHSADGWILNGSKRLIDNAANAHFIVVSARTDPEAVPHRGISLFVVRKDDPGFHYGGTFDTLGLRAAGVGWFTLQDCRVPDDRLLGALDRGFYQMMDMVEFGRTGVAAICLGICEVALESATRFLAGRAAFGRPLAENDVVLATVADLRIRIDAARLLTARAARLVDDGVRCDAEAAMAKVFASELAVEATTRALHLHGGIGFTTEAPIELLVRDSHAFTIGEGTSEVLRMLVGRREFRASGATSAVP
jgi:butyryl-CoA dehydrogenase